MSTRERRRSDPRLARRLIAEVTPSQELPETWAWVSPDEVADDVHYAIAIGPFGSNLVRSDYKDTGVRLVFVRDIRRNEFGNKDARYIDEQKAQELHQHVVESGDVLITKMGDPPGDTAIFPRDTPPAIITADCIKLRPHPSLARSEYLASCIRTPIVREQIGDITLGVAHQKVSLDRFRRIALPLPPLREQQEIAARLRASFARIDQAEAEADRSLALLARLDAAILARAFRGELMPQDPADEPARLSSPATAARPRRSRAAPPFAAPP